nr:MAG TPA: hypothetical protein [Caudoviricetes sp.]
MLKKLALLVTPANATLPVPLSCIATTGLPSVWYVVYIVVVLLIIHILFILTRCKDTDIFCKSQI